MQINWPTVSIAIAGFAAAAAVFIFGGDDGSVIATALVTGILGFLIPHPPSSKAAQGDESEE